MPLGRNNEKREVGSRGVRRVFLEAGEDKDDRGTTRNRCLTRHLILTNLYACVTSISQLTRPCNVSYLLIRREAVTANSDLPAASRTFRNNLLELILVT